MGLTEGWCRELKIVSRHHQLFYRVLKPPTASTCWRFLHLEEPLRLLQAIIGEAPSEHLNYYDGYDTITQNSAGDITLECVSGKTHVYVSNQNYSVDFLDDEGTADDYGKYIGTLYQ